MSAATEAYAPRVCALQKATPMRSPCTTTLLAATKESQCAAMKTNNNNNNNNNKIIRTCLPNQEMDQTYQSRFDLWVGNPLEKEMATHSSTFAWEIL